MIEGVVDTAPDGAFTIEGGGWGQDETEASFRNQFTIPSFTSGNALANYQSQLSKLPLDALKSFETLVPGGGLFDNVGNAVSSIMGALVEVPLKILQAMFNQIVEIFNGFIVTPINSAIQGIKDWFQGLIGDRQAVHDMAGNINSAISGGDRVGSGIFAGVFDTIANIFGVAVSAQQQIADITSAAQNPGESGYDGAKWQTVFAGTNGAAISSADWPVNSGITIRGNNGYAGIASSAATNQNYYARAATPFTLKSQYVSCVVGDSAMEDQLTYVILRSDPTVSSFCWLGFSMNKLVIGYTVNGVVTTLSQISTVIRTGDIVAFRVTDDGVFQGLVNGTARIVFPDTNNTLSANRYAAFAMTKQTFFLKTYESFRLVSFAMSDYVPIGATVTTPSWRLRRSNSATVALVVEGGSLAPLPTGFYDTQDLATDAVVTTLGTGQVRIETEGWYELSVTGTARNTLQSSSYGYLTEAYFAVPWVLYVDGVSVAGPIPSGVTITTYLAKGQTVRPGVSASAPLFPGVAGDTTLAPTSTSKIEQLSGGPSASFTGRRL